MNSGKTENLPSQAPFPIAPAIQAAVEALANAAGSDARGAVFTRPEVVAFILDLVGYTPDKPLYQYRLLEPSFGNGDFLLVAVTRLLAACRQARLQEEVMLPLLAGAIRGVELHRETFRATKEKLACLLRTAGLPAREQELLLDRWLCQGDFLLTPFSGAFTHVVGNPPYVRQERIPDVLLAEYRQRYHTLFDRADLYVPFIERSLRLLAPGGALGFICADRWMKNRYGGPLRQMIAESFHLQTIVDMVGTPAFHADVTAYPAITIIRHTTPGMTHLVCRPDIRSESLGQLAKTLSTGHDVAGSPVLEISLRGGGDAPWLLGETGELALIQRLEAEYPLLEAAGCRVGIGVATGADKILVGRHEQLDIEPDRKLPLVMADDLRDGAVRWRGYSVINPFGEDGELVSLAAYPQLARYLEAHRATLSKRHVAQRRPSGWFRTIDRIHPDLAARPKLLIPDIKDNAHVVYEGGKLYPHHNLYYIVSDEWDLRALQTVLQSGLARLFVSAYSTKMRGGYLRFQAQYLRRIRIPLWREIPAALKAELAAAADQDAAARNRAVARLYHLTTAEQSILFS